MTFCKPNAVELIEAAKPTMRRGSWAVCMMSVLEPGARSDADCVTAGWPEWLSILNHTLYDADVGGDEEESAFQFALAVAQAIQTPRNYDRARDLFLIRRLDTGEYSALKSIWANPVDADWWRACEAAIVNVVLLLRRRANGDDVAGEMAAASAAARAAANFAADAASAAAYAASAAAHAARAAANFAAHAADAAAHAARAASAVHAARAARAAARAAAAAASNVAERDDLIYALMECPE